MTEEVKFTITEKVQLLTDVKIIKDKLEGLPCKSRGQKLNKMAIYLAVLAALTLGSSAVKYII